MLKIIHYSNMSQGRNSVGGRLRLERVDLCHSQNINMNVLSIELTEYIVTVTHN